MDQIYFNTSSHHKLDIILFIVFTIIRITKSETTEGDLFKNKQQQNKQNTHEKLAVEIASCSVNVEKESRHPNSIPPSLATRAT